MDIFEFIYTITVLAATEGDVGSYFLIVFIYVIVYIAFKLLIKKFKFIPKKIKKYVIYFGLIHIYGCLLVTGLTLWYPLLIILIATPILIWKKDKLMYFFKILKYKSNFFNPFSKFFYEYRANCIVIPNRRFTFVKIIELEPFKEILSLLIALSRLNINQEKSKGCDNLRYTIEVNKTEHEYMVYLLVILDSKNYLKGINELIEIFTKLVNILERLGYYYKIINDEIGSEKIFFKFLNNNPFIFDDKGSITNFPEIQLKENEIEINQTSTLKLCKVNTQQPFELYDILKDNSNSFYWICQIRPLLNKEFDIRMKELKTELKKIYEKMENRLVDKGKKLQFIIMMNGLENDPNTKAEFSSYIFGDLWNEKLEREKSYKKFILGQDIGIFKVSCYMAFDSNEFRIGESLGLDLEYIHPIDFFKIISRNVSENNEITSRDLLQFLPFCVETKQKDQLI